MRDYELTVLLRPTQTDKELDKEVKALSDLLTKVGAKVISKTDPKKQVLSYEIADTKEAYYVFCELSMDPANAAEVDQKFKLSENVIMYLLVKKE